MNDSDYVSREEVTENVYQALCEPSDSDAWRRIGRAIRETAAADVRENVRGGWVKDELGTTVCSKCKEPRRDNRIKHIAFCNSCGADMRRE